MKSILVASLWAVGVGVAYAQPTITSIVDPFTGSTKLAPGGRAMITGTNLGLGGVVTVGGVNAFELVQPQLGPTMTIQIPVNAPTGASVPVIVTTGAGPSTAFNIALAQYAPILVSATSGALTSPRHANGVGVTGTTPAAAGEAVTFYAIGLGATNPAVNTGALATNTTTNTTATATVTFGANSPVNATASRLANGQGFFGANASSGLVGNSQALIGIYIVSFTVPSGTATGSYPVTITIGGVTSNAVNVAVGPAPTAPVISAIVGESGKGALCPGDVAILSGLNLGANPAVTVGGIAAYTITPPNNGNEMTIQIPVDATVASVNVVLTLGAGQSSAPFTVTLTQFAPAIPYGFGSGPFGGAFPPFHLNTQKPVTTAAPAVPGETLFILMYGLGPTTPVVPTGATAPSNPAPPTVTTPTVTLSGTTITAGVSAAANSNQVGQYFVTFTVPQNQPAVTNIAIWVTIGGVTSNQAGVTVFTGPVISNVTNAASNITAGLPNAGIAQGSIFTLFGTNLGPSAISIAQAAFQNTSLSGTSIAVTINGTTTAPLMYYTSAGQVAALLPSSTPAGTGTITVTYNNQVGLAAPITVVANNLGIFTPSSDGQGAAIITNADYSLVSVTQAANCGGPDTTCGAANPGDTLILWATGLGPVSGGDGVQSLGQQSPVSLTLWVGGIAVTPSYQGRSGCCIAEDQIVFTLPPNVPTGCAVPLVAQIGNLISNSTVMPIAPKGSRTCTATASFFPSSALQQITSGAFNFGNVQLDRQYNISPQGQVTYADQGKATFATAGVPAALQPFMTSYLDDLPAGTCAIYNNLNGGNTGSNYLNLAAALDPGTIQVSGPNGSQTIPVDAQGQTVLSAAGTYLAPGAYTISGSGGSGTGAVGSFTQQYNIPTLPNLTSPASGANVNVTRANGVTVTWSGGSANGVVQIQGMSATDSSFTNGANFTCFVAANAGTFTVPPAVLLALPAGTFGGMTFEFDPAYSTFNATGLDLGFVQASYDTPIFATFQ